VFALADKLLRDLETHPTAKGVSSEKIGTAAFDAAMASFWGG
jgi:hypothetical protein